MTRISGLVKQINSLDMAVNLKSAELKIFIYSGSAGESNRGDAKYTLTKTRLSSESTIVFEISELVKDYLPVVFNGTPPNVLLNAWVETEITRTFVDTTTNNESTDQEPLFRRYIAFRGYGEIFDINSEHGTNINPDTSYDVLISNRTIYHLEGYPLYVPFFTAPEKGVFSIVYKNNDNVIETQKYGGNVNRLSTDTTKILTSAVDPYYTDSTALRSNDDGSFSPVSQSNASVITTIEFTNKKNQTEVINVKYITECKHEPYLISFINKFGAIQQLWFFKRSERQFNVGRDDYTAVTLKHENGNFDFASFDHTNRNISINGTKSITMNTGYVTEDHNEVIKQLLVSEYCWLHESQDETVTPVKPKNVSFTEKTGVNDKLINFTLDFEFSHNYIQDVR
jgi:hypothetical protein